MHNSYSNNQQQVTANLFCDFCTFFCSLLLLTFWLLSRTAAHTSQPLFTGLYSFSALCCRSRSLLLWSLPCSSASAQILGVLSRMHTTARADRKELSAKKALCRSRLETWHGNYRMGIVLIPWPAALLWRIPRRPLCPHKSTLHPMLL